MAVGLLVCVSLVRHVHLLSRVGLADVFFRPLQGPGLGQTEVDRLGWSSCESVWDCLVLGELIRSTV